MKTIKLGDNGEEVQTLQELLNKQGVFVGLSGVFDEETRNAVVDFQKKHGLDADGIVGFRSWETFLFERHETDGKLVDKDIELVANLLGVELAALKAVQHVETGGRGGFFGPGKPAILFEGHVFWRQLKKRGFNPETLVTGNENILYPKWVKTHYKGGLGEYDRLEQARKIDKEAADASASWGMFQIMGFNYAACGQKSVESFVNAMCKNELSQLRLSAIFIKNSGMLPALKEKNWAEFARRYNGPAYAQNKYDEKMAKAYMSYI